MGEQITSVKKKVKVHIKLYSPLNSVDEDPCVYVSDLCSPPVDDLCKYYIAEVEIDVPLVAPIDGVISCEGVDMENPNG